MEERDIVTFQIPLFSKPGTRNRKRHRSKEHRRTKDRKLRGPSCPRLKGKCIIARKRREETQKKQKKKTHRKKNHTGKDEKKETKAKTQGEERNTELLGVQVHQAQVVGDDPLKGGQVQGLLQARDGLPRSGWGGEGRRRTQNR